MLNRLTDILKAKINRAMDETEDPAEMLDYSYTRLLEHLQQVRRGVADVATSRIRVQSHLTKLNEQIARLDDQARQALALGREDLARAALTRKATIEPQARALAAQVEDLEMQQHKLLDGEVQLAGRIEAFRAHKETVKAQYTAAQARVHIGEAVTGLSEEMGAVQLTIERAREKTERMQARAAALDELAAGPALPAIGPGDGDDIARELARLTTGDVVEQQLDAMKRALLAHQDTPKLLESGE